MITDTLTNQRHKEVYLFISQLRTNDRKLDTEPLRSTAKYCYGMRPPQAGTPSVEVVWVFCLKIRVLQPSAETFGTTITSSLLSSPQVV
jgi:uncharacterized protein VirK/YbjX